MQFFNIAYMNNNISKIGWRFDNTYSKLPDTMLSKLAPIPVKAPKIVILNYSLSKELGLNFSNKPNKKKIVQNTQEPILSTYLLIY